MSKTLGEKLSNKVEKLEKDEKERLNKHQKMMEFCDRSNKEFALESIKYEIKVGPNLIQQAEKGKTKYKMPFFREDICSFIKEKLHGHNIENGIHLEFQYGTKMIQDDYPEAGWFHNYRNYSQERSVIDYSKCFVKFSWEKINKN